MPAWRSMIPSSTLATDNHRTPSRSRARETWYRSMAVRVGLDDRCDLDVRANHGADGLIIRGDLRQRYLRPRPVLHAHPLRPPASERISFSYASVTASQRVPLAHARHRPLRPRGAFLTGHREHLAHFRVEVIVSERDAGAARHLPILRRVQVQRSAPRPMCFDQRGMRAADLRRLNIGEAVRLKFLIPVAINRTRASRCERSVVSRTLADVVLRVGRVADRAPASCRVSTRSNASRTSSALFSGSMRLTYRKYPPGSSPSVPATSVRGYPANFRSVRNECRCSCCTAPCNTPRSPRHRSRPRSGRTLQATRKADTTLRRARSTSSDCARARRHSVRRASRRAGASSEKIALAALQNSATSMAVKQQVERRTERVRDRVEVLVPDGRKIAQRTPR